MLQTIIKLPVSNRTISSHRSDQPWHSSLTLKEDFVRSELQILKTRKVGPDCKSIAEGGEGMELQLSGSGMGEWGRVTL